MPPPFQNGQSTMGRPNTSAMPPQHDWSGTPFGQPQQPPMGQPPMGGPAPGHGWNRPDFPGQGHAFGRMEQPFGNKGPNMGAPQENDFRRMPMGMMPPPQMSPMGRPPFAQMGMGQGVQQGQQQMPPWLLQMLQQRSQNRF